MAWQRSPNAIIPGLPGGVPGLSPANIPIPLTPAGQPMQIMGAQQGYYLQPQQYGQSYGAVAPGYQQPYASPFQQQIPLYGQPASGGFAVDAAGMYPHQRERTRARDDNPPLDKFMDGSNYGPVLDSTTATIYEVKLHINPVLKYMLEQDDDDDKLNWDVLESPKEAHIMQGKTAKPFSARHSCATFPRIDRLYLLSPYLPSPIEVRGTSKSGAVTCGDVLTYIHDYMKEKLSRPIYESLSKQRRAKVDATYHYNRSVKSGPDLGTGIRRGDFLEEYTVFEGLEVDDEYVRSALELGKLPKGEEGNKLKQRPMVGHLVLRLEHREGDDIPVPEPIEPETSRSPRTKSEDLSDEGSEDDDAPVVYAPVRKGKGKKGKRNIAYQPQPYVGYPPPPPGMIPVQPGMGGQPYGQPVAYAAPAGYVQQGQYLMPMQGYVPGQSPAMAQYQLPPGGHGYPGLGSPLPGQRPIR